MQWHMAAPITSVSAITAETHLNGCGQSTPLQCTATLLCSGIYLEQPAVPIVKFGEHTSIQWVGELKYPKSLGKSM